MIVEPQASEKDRKEEAPSDARPEGNLDAQKASKEADKWSEKRKKTLILQGLISPTLK
jgi:hypothetical protein